MNGKLTLLLTLAFFHAAAFADIRTITEAYEVDLSNFRAPGTANGTLAMRDCSSCTPKTLRVTSATRYIVNDQEVSLAEFRRQLASNGNKRDAMLVVSHHLESDLVTAVRVSL